MNKLTTFSRAILAIVIMLCVALPTLAHDFEVGGIYYNYLDKTAKTVEVTCRGYYYFDYSNEYTGSVTIPSSVTYSGTTYSVTSIGAKAFYNCTGLTSVTIGNSVTSIGAKAFYNCTGLTSVTIGNSVTSIGDEAFFNCYGLTSVTIGNSVTSIGSSAFSSCRGLIEVNISDLSAWYKIDFGDFNANPLYYAKKLKLNETEIKDLVIPNDITKIKDYAFYNCTGLTTITIPNSVTSIGEEAFSLCSGLTEVNITDLSAWCKIDFSDYSANPLNYAKKLKLNGTEIKDLVIPNDITKIKDYAFYNCAGLTTITIPNSVTTIGNYVFYDCYRLTEVTIPNSVTSIGEYAFDSCWNLDTIISLNPTPPVCANSNSFYNYSRPTLYIPKDSYAKYFIDDVWGRFTNIKKIEILVSSIILNNSTIELDKGNTATLTAGIAPYNATIKNIVWTSSNPQIATVDKSGKVTALSAGTATITAMANDGSNVSASCKVVVKEVETKITLSQTEANLPVNDIMTLSYEGIPLTTPVEWSTSNENVAYIKKNADNSVTVVGMADGVAIITAKALDGSGVSASCVVTVGVGGVEGVEMDNNAVEVSRYDIHGRLLSEPTPGINIVKMSNGTTRKVIVK
ncbi:MAG: leucine-rich repeat protein [Muribaculaceae bacterium]|nr:leucine-rich repeat protein [Muribaculaceae bacterium]